MNALAGFLERTDFWWRLKRTFLVFWVPIVGTAIVLVLVTAVGTLFEKPSVMPAQAKDKKVTFVKGASGMARIAHVQD